MRIDGIFVLDKPAGWVSTRCVSLVRRLTGVRRVGHAGTLDPFATGVLPVCVGAATRVVEAIHDSSKSYVATLALGVETDTGDTEGEAIGGSDPSRVSVEQVQSALAPFTGEITQVPPAHSALKIAGVPAYRLARRGVTPVLEPRRVRIEAIVVRGFEAPWLTLEIECGRGTYIRSLARDIGRALGCGAHLAALRRTRVGRFGRPIEPEVLEEAFQLGSWPDLLLPLDTALSGWKAAVLGDAKVELLGNGRSVALPGLTSPLARCVAYSLAGEAVALLARRTAESWHPEVVFHTAGGHIP